MLGDRQHPSSKTTHDLKSPQIVSVLFLVSHTQLLELGQLGPPGPGETEAQRPCTQPSWVPRGCVPDLSHSEGCCLASLFFCHLPST